MPAPTDLTSLADCKAWLGLTSTGDDAVLAALITAISAAILANLGRSVQPTTVTEMLDGGGASLPLRHWPVTSVAAVSIDGAALAASAAPGAGGWRLDSADAAPPGAMQRLTFVGGRFPPGPGAVAVTYRAGYEVLGEPALVPAAAPYVVTAQAPFGAWCLDTGVVGAPGPYTVAAGTYSFTAASAGASLALSYGYVPADLARACLEWVADRYAARSRIGVASKSLGGQETASFVVKAMPDVVSRLLQPYRRVAR